MNLAFLYAGQGSQHAGMGQDLYEIYPLFRQILDDAPVDFDLKKLCFEGPEDQLSQTRYTQPCMVAFAAGVTALLKRTGHRSPGRRGLYSPRSHRPGRFPWKGHGRGRPGHGKRHVCCIEPGPEHAGRSVPESL